MPDVAFASKKAHNSNVSTGAAIIEASLNAHPPAPGDPLSGFRFAADWLASNASALELLPRFDTALAAAIDARLKRPSEPWSVAETGELESFNLAADNPAGAQLAPLLAQPGTLAVVTGQQPNLLASPLYILHKALSAVALARRVAAQTGREVVAIFWVASDDHDFEELRESWLVRPDGELTNLGAVCSRGTGLPPASPAYAWEIAPSVERLLEVAAGCMPGDLLNLLEVVLRRSSTFEDLFCRTLALLLGPAHPVLFVAPRLQAMRRRQVAVLEREFAGDIPTNEILSAAGLRMDAAGYGTVLDRSADLVNAFYLEGSSRQRIVRTAHGFQLQDAVKHIAVRDLSFDELHELLHDSPERFTTNVVTRPLFQDSALPTMAYLAGPGEIAYLAQLSDVYAAHGVPRAAVGLRTLVTIRHQDTARAMVNLGLPPDASLAEVRGRMLQQNPVTREMLRPMEELQELVLRNIDEMESRVAAEHPHLLPAFRKTERTLERSVARLRERVARQASPEEWNTIARAIALLAPRGHSQERWLSPWNFISPENPAALANHLMHTIDYAAMAPPQSASHFS